MEQKREVDLMDSPRLFDQQLRLVVCRVARWHLFHWKPHAMTCVRHLVLILGILSVHVVVFTAHTQTV